MSDVEYGQLLSLSRRMRAAEKIMPKKAEKFIDERVAQPMVEEMQRTAPVRSGNLRDNHRVVHPSGGVWQIGVVGVPYAGYVIDGTRPHEIKPKTASVLVFEINGQKVFARSVKHPGTKPNPYQQEAAKKVLKRALPRLAGITAEVTRNGS